MLRSIRIFTLGAVPGVLWAAPAIAQPFTSAAGVCDRQALHAWLAADPQRVSLGDARISLVLPPGMRGLAPSEAAQVTGNELADLVFANDEGTVVSIRSTAGVMENQAMVLRLIYSRTESEGAVAGRFDWIKQGEPVELEGHPATLYEYVHRALRDRRDRYVRHYWLNIQGSTTVVRFSADPRRRSEAARSAATLRVHDCAWPDGAAADSAGAGALAETPRVCSEEQLRADLAGEPRRVAMAGGRVSLVPPAGMDAISPPGKDPQVNLAYASPETSGMIMVALGTEPPVVDSPEYQQMLRQRYEAGFENVEWIAREVVEIGGTRWLRLEFTGEHRGMSMHQQYYLTPFLNGGVIMALVVPASTFPAARPELAASVATIRVHDCDLGA